MSRQCINRVTARYLNSFEPNRMQSKPFIGVQTIDAMKKYGALWSRLVVFLLRIQDHEDPSLGSRLLHADRDGEIQQLLQETRDASQALHAANPQGLPFVDCLHDKTTPAEEEEEDLGRLRLHAKTLIDTVDRLSIALVRQLRYQDPFSLCVVTYCATWALNKHGAWVHAADFRPFLSGMIHCMQLWLLSYCLHQHRRQSPQPTLQDFVRDQCQLHLINTTSGPIAELSYWRLITRAARNDAAHPPVTTITDNCMQVNHGDIELRLPAWRQALQALLREAISILDTDLLFGLGGLIDRPADSLQDNMAELRPGQCFLDDPRNGLHAVRDDVVNQLLKTPELRLRFVEERPPSNSGAEPFDTVVGNRLQMDSYLHANQRFLQLLAVLMIMTGGLPPRRKELLGISWCNQETPRNIYIYDGLLAIITSYHKSQWRVGSRPVARFLAPCLGDVLIRYLIYVPPVLRFFSHCMQSQCPRGFLFSSGEGVWPPTRLSAATKLHTKRVLGFPIRLRQWRHIAIALDRRFLQGVACQVYNISADRRDDQDNTSDSDLDLPTGGGSSSQPLSNHPSTASSVHHWQAAHTTETNVSHYGNPSSPFSLLTDTLLADFCSVSRQFHQLAHFQSVPVTACNRKRPVSSSGEQPRWDKKPLLGSRRYIRRQLWTWPAIEQSLKDLFGPDATARDCTQRDALRLLASSVPESVIIMPTGGGKTTLYMALSRLSTAEVTVVIVPFVALRQDLIRRCREHAVPYWHYNHVDRMQDRLHAVPSLVLVDVDTAVTSAFMAFLRQLNDLGRLDRLVLDEAHLVLTSSDYRENLGLLGMLRQITCPFVCLTATLPPHGMLDIKQSLFLSHPVIHRASSDRPNLEYCVQSLESPTTTPSTPSSTEDRLALAAVQICQQDLRQWQASRDHTGSAARSICYVRQRTMGSWLAKQLDCDFYHAQLPASERASILTAWNEGQRSPVLVATSALGAGVDYPSVRRIIHADAPDGLVAYGQETGRAGRDGLHAVCTVILPPKWSVSWDRRYRNDFLSEDVKHMTRFLQTRQCLRKLLTGYLDGPLGGREGTACNEADQIDRVPCMNCCRQTIPAPPPGPAYAEEYPQGQGDSPHIRNRESTANPGCGLDTAHEVDTVSHNSAIDSAADDPVSDLEESSSACNTEQDLPTSPPPQPEALDTAALHARLESMEHAEAQALYEQRLAIWGRACILCSFLHRRRTPFPHQGCMQSHFADSLTRFRRSVRFDRGIGCFRCGQPELICQQKGRTGCHYPWLIFHCCWVALSQDPLYSIDLLRLLGGPDLSGHASLPAVEQQTGYLQWISRRCLMFGRFPTSNAMRLAFFWIDRLESLTSV